MNLLKTTKEERKETLNELEKSVKESKREISRLKDEISDLTDNNISKITRRKNVRRTIFLIKLGGNALMILGGLVALSSLFLFSVHTILGILAIAGGVALAIYGLIVRSKWKKHMEELEDSNDALENYDAQVRTRKDSIQEHDDNIDECKAKIDEIKDFDKYENFYRFDADCKKGYLLVFTTGNEDTTAQEPRPPKKKARYNPDFLTNTQVFLNDACHLEVAPKKFDRQKGTFSLLQFKEEEAQKFHLVANYLNGTEACQWTGKPLTLSRDTESVFIWNHISLYENGCQVYTQECRSLEGFMDSVGLTKDDIQEML